MVKTELNSDDKRLSYEHLFKFENSVQTLAVDAIASEGSDLYQLAWIGFCVVLKRPWLFCYYCHVC